MRDGQVIDGPSVSGAGSYAMTAPGIKGSYHTRWVSGDGAERVDGPDLNLGPPGVDTRWYYDADAIGSVRLVTDANGAVVERHDYLPFGTEWSPSGDGDLEKHKVRFAGKEHDVENALDYFGARYYQSQTGRFTSVDPGLDIQAALLNPQRWNRYAYVSNNPLRKVDPDGRYEIDVHLYLTRVLARAAGIDRATAERIGAADQGVDDNPSTGPFADRAARRDFHFTSPARRTQLWDAFEDSGSPEDLGIFFHAQQDSFSHEGFGPTFGHLSAGHRPDKTFNAPDKADAMARDTYDRLREAIPHLRGTGGKALPWEKVRPYMSRFNRATELDDKYRILDELTRAIQEYK
ncbi:MAG: RHS repeat-associated core domain-containing protein [Vicinamibacterales bacterium]